MDAQPQRRRDESTSISSLAGNRPLLPHPFAGAQRTTGCCPSSLSNRSGNKARRGLGWASTPLREVPVVHPQCRELQHRSRDGSSSKKAALHFPLRMVALSAYTTAMLAGPAPLGARQTPFSTPTTQGRARLILHGVGAYGRLCLGSQLLSCKPVITLCLGWRSGSRERPKVAKWAGPRPLQLELR
jgi:hypothetical protein